MSDNKDDSVQGTVSLPSADLIKYRFDHIDSTLTNLNTKMDNLTTNAVPRSEINSRFEGVQKILTEHSTQIGKLKETDDIQQGYIDANKYRTNRNLAIASIVAVLLAAILTAVLTARK